MRQTPRGQFILGQSTLLIIPQPLHPPFFFSKVNKLLFSLIMSSQKGILLLDCAPLPCSLMFNVQRAAAKNLFHSGALMKYEGGILPVQKIMTNPVISIQVVENWNLKKKKVNCEQAYERKQTFQFQVVFIWLICLCSGNVAGFVQQKCWGFACMSLCVCFLLNKTTIILTQ